LKLSVIGAGGVGQVISRHLGRVEKAEVKVGDLDRSRLREVAKSSGVSTSRLDAGKPEEVGKFIAGSDVVINSSHPRFNMLIMRQALKRRVNYIDLAGYPAEQLKQDSRWKKAGLVAILGMGEDPGLSNVLARRATDMLDRVHEIRIRDGETSTSETYPFVALFAPDVFLEEAVSPAHYFEGGETKTTPPMSGKELYRFPPPIGEVAVYGMDHEEVHTLPKYLPKTPKYVDFKLALTDDAVSAIRLFQGLGLLSRKPIRAGNVKVSPLDVLLHLLPTPSQTAGKIRGSAGILVEVKGEVAGELYEDKWSVAMTHDEAYEKYRSNATSYLTGTPTTVCALLLAKGVIENRGVIVPECLNAEAFVEEARKLDLQIQVEKTRL
jgi:saccharopine dehydrogenase (NAD+, L-lysine-forming)